ERFRKNVELQGGDPTVCDKPEKLIDKKLKKIPVTAEKNGFITAIDTHCLGQSIGNIGGGRIKAEDEIDHAVGFSCSIKLGDKIRRGDELGVIHCRSQRQADSIIENIRNAYTIGPKKPETTRLVRATV
ncbi:MAG TPA: hypothetical protein VL501_10100, partial [Pyrinomonadaceae bacterium]|nr:hypothetical protein [Pyrinomonadaceae bacterium]